MSQVKDNRPLSPHLSVYRWMISNTLSILHRVTGFGLTLGLVPFALWLYALAYDAGLYVQVTDFFSSLLGQLMLFGWTLAFYYHLGNGIRHLNWDIGNGFELHDMKATGQLVIVFAITATIFTWILATHHLGA